MIFSVWSIAGDWETQQIYSAGVIRERRSWTHLSLGIVRKALKGPSVWRRGSLCTNDLATATVTWAALRLTDESLNRSIKVRSP